MLELKKVNLQTVVKDGKTITPGKLEENITLTVQKARSYFEFLKNNKPSQTFYTFPEKSEYGLDNLGTLQKGGGFTLDNNCKLVRKKK